MCQDHHGQTLKKDKNVAWALEMASKKDKNLSGALGTYPEKKKECSKGTRGS